MKKLITFSIIGIITCIMFSSCSNMTIAKRHYNNGYYVDLGHNKGKKAVEPKEEEKVVQIKATESLYSTPDTTNLNSALSPTENNVVAASTEKVQSEIILQQDIKQVLNDKIKIIINRNAKLDHSRSELKKLKSQSSESNGLSLFWIIILVLLILWALGLAGGIGGFINLLLLIALILLILWLLRVI